MALSIPSRKLPGPESFPTETAGVRDWLVTLQPLSDAGNGNALRRGLKHSNRLQTDNQNRVAIAALFEPAIETAVTSLKSEFVDLSQPLPPKAEHSRQLALELLAERAFQYKIIVHDTYASLSDRQPQFRSEAIFKALQSLATVIECYLINQSEPEPSLLLDANTLYAMAEKSQLTKTTFDPDTADPAEGWSIETAYIYLLLLFMLQPWNQRHRQIASLIEFLREQAPTLGISKIDPEQTQFPDTLYAIELEQSGRPHLLRHTARPGGDTLRALDIAPLLQTLDETSARTPDNVHTHIESEGLTRIGLQRLREAVFRQNTRGHSRAITRKSVLCEMGFTQITAAVRFANETGADSSVATLAEPANYWPQTPIHRKNRWVVINENRFGACLEWLDKEPTDAAVGELVALKRKNRDAKPSWVLGTVQWLKATGAGKVQVGVEYLATRTSREKVEHTVDDLTTSHECLKATLLANVLPDQMRDIIITRLSLFKPADSIRHGTQTLVLGEKILATSGFDVFVYASVEERDGADEGAVNG